MAKAEKNERFVVKNDSEADWALEKIKELKEEQKEKEELAQERMEPLEKKMATIEKWRDLQVKQIQDNIGYFEWLLTEYAMQLKKEDEELKTHSLPFGKLKFRKRRPKWNYEDDKLLEFLETTGMGAIRVKKQVDKRALKKIVEIAGDKVVHAETGEVVEGVDIQERGEKFSIDVEGE